MNEGTGQRIYELLLPLFNQKGLDRIFLSTQCDSFVEPVSYDSKKKLIKQLEDFKNNLLDEDFLDSELKGLIEEINVYKQTCTISQYFEKDEKLQKDLIDTFSRMNAGEEGLVSIPQQLNYEQLKKLSRGVFAKTGSVQFFISNESRIKGRIVSEVFETSKDTPLAHVCVKNSKESSETQLFLFGEVFNKKVWQIVREVSMPLFFYNFLSETNKEIMLITSVKQETGNCEIQGVLTTIDDYSNITDSKKVLTKLPVFFAKSVENSIETFEDHKKFFEMIKEEGVTFKTFFNFLFSFKRFNDEVGSEEFVYGSYPEWFKWLMWSWVLHSEKGDSNKYPFHVLMVGPSGSGKSHVGNVVHDKVSEGTNPWSGEVSTLKDLIPSFRGNFPKRGYLADSVRFCFLDEFLRVLVNKSGGDYYGVEESLASMNSLLEHQKRRFGSGNGSVIVNMTSRVFATTNPVRGVKSISDMVDRYDNSFLNRWLVFWQPSDFVKLVEVNKGVFFKQDLVLGNEKFLSIVDYCQSFHVRFDVEKLFGIVDSVKPLLSGDMLDLYNARCRHHAKCLFDGLVKARCLFEKDDSFKGRPVDFERFGVVWKKLFSTWIPDLGLLKKVDFEHRVHFLPENCQYLLSYLFEHEGVDSRFLRGDVDLSYNELVVAFEVLRENELLFEVDGLVYSFRGLKK